MISEWPAKHSREIHPVLKFLVIAEPYLSATINPNISDFFDLCLHWAFFFHGQWFYSSLNNIGIEINHKIMT